jgi:hypothetical protein
LLLQFSDGLLYHANTFGGSGAQGTLFKSDLTGKMTVTRSFTGNNGSQLFSFGRAIDGNLCGIAEGRSGQGVFLCMSPAGTVTVLHNFTNNGGTPTGPAIRAAISTSTGRRRKGAAAIIYTGSRRAAR